MNKHASGDAARRREVISEIISSADVHSQEELQALLRRRGMHVTQPTLSRDLRELGVAKSPRGYVLPGALASSNVAAFTPRDTLDERLNRLIKSSVLSAEAAMNLVVIKTAVADAQPLASALDAATLDDVLGTIGGDDTIFVALSNPAAASTLAEHIRTVAGITPARRRTRA